MTTEKDFLFTADIFIDATGDGMLAFQAGARVMHGREGKAVFGESLLRMYRMITPWATA